MKTIPYVALRFMAPLSVAALLALPATPAQAQARTWVSGVGDDVNPLSLIHI